MSLLPSSLVGESKKIERRILVIGAGFAGLACANELSAMGYRVTVAEARNRVGGRVLSLPDFLRPLVIEGGGELVGENHATWWALAEKFGLDLVAIDDEDELQFPVVVNGRRLELRESENIYREMEKAFGALVSPSESIDADQPWISSDAENLDRTPVSAWISELEVAPAIKTLVSIQIASDNGVACDQASMLGLLAMIRGGGGDSFWELTETHRCKQGNQALAVELARSIGLDSIRLNTPVTVVDTSATNVRVTFADRRTEEYDEIVLAVPPSVWKKIEFSPALPKALSIQMGRAVKYLAAVDQRFWLESKLSPEGFSDGLVSQTWEAMNAGTEPSTPTVMIGFSGGPQADAGLSLSPANRDREYGKAIDLLYPNFTKHFQASRMMAWPREEWTSGGYAFPAPGEIMRVGALLRNGHEKIQFAGEHTCYAFVGYMEGALKSGIDLARRLAARDGLLPVS